MMKRDLRRLADQPFQVLVIGGGIHGAMAAWDAALRGLSVALIEKADFGGGTSQNSLKIIHGGLRYLQDANPSRIRTMSRERTTWMKIAPHLIHPLPCLLPTQPNLTRNSLVMKCALQVNDCLSFDRNRLRDPQKTLPGSKIISRQDLSHLLPGYDVRTSTGAAIWYDAQIYNSERLLFDVILSAVDAGAVVANYVEAVDLLKQGSQVIGLAARDTLTGERFEIRAGIVINCSGAWMNTLLGKATLPFEYASSLAINVIVDQVWPGIAAGLSSRPTNGKPPQVLFIVPWRNKSMIGTWHLHWSHGPDSFRMTEHVIQAFINEINSAHPALNLSLSDIQHVTWGFLPVNKRDAGLNSVRLTRDGIAIDHQKKDGVRGLISILGVKYSTARVVAARAVDLAVYKLGLKAITCRTHLTPVQGGQIEDFRVFLNDALIRAPRVLDQDIVEHLAYTYGSEHPQLMRYIEEQPALAQRIDLHLPVTVAEVMHAIQHEMVLTLADLVQRRTELGAMGLPAMATLQKCAELLGRQLDWTLDREQREIESVIQAYPFQKMERILA